MHFFFFLVKKLDIFKINNLLEEDYMDYQAILSGLDTEINPVGYIGGVQNCWGLDLWEKWCWGSSWESVV